MRFAIFPFHLSEVLPLPRKSEASSYEVLHLLRKILSEDLKIWCSKMQPLSGNQRPHLQTSLAHVSLVLRLPTPRLPTLLNLLQNPHVLHTFFCPALATQNHISTSKSAPNLTAVHSFDFKMCFLPQRRALFQQRNFRKCSKNGMPLPFWLPNVLPATTMSTFSTSQLPKALQISQFFTVLTSKCASCHNGVHFFNSATSESAPRMVCLYLFDFQMCFLPQRCALFRHLNFQNCSEPDSFFLPSFDFEMCFVPQWRAIVYLSCGQMAPHPPL